MYKSNLNAASRDVGKHMKTKATHIPATLQASSPSGNKKTLARKRYKIEINNRLCKGCFICIRYCPMGVIAESHEIGELGYDLAKVEHPEKCTGCRLCLLYCPDLAIAIAEEGTEKR
jgi:2-oxoglutarate ferredoxin oxidoreductase subunit delta